MLKILGLKKRDRQFNLILISVIVFAIIWRFYQIETVPGGLSAREIDILNQVADITKNWHVTADEITKSFYLFLFAVFGKLSHFNILFLRTMQAVISLATIIIFYFFTREWFNRRVALFATLFLSINAFYLSVSRIIEPKILIPLFVIAITYLFTLAFLKDKYYLFALSGFVSALALYVDEIFFILPFIFALSLYYFHRRNHKFIKNYWQKILVTLGIFLVFAIPYIYFLPQTLSSILSTYNPGSIGRLFLGTGLLISTLLYRAPVDRLYYIGTLPLLSPFIAVTFVCGFIYAFFHIERRRYYFLMVILIILTILLSLGINNAPLNYLAIYPVIFILSATIFEYILNVWFKTFPYNRAARLSFALVLSLFLFLSVFYNYQKYYDGWAKNKEVKSEYKMHFEYK